VHTVTGKV